MLWPWASGLAHTHRSAASCYCPSVPRSLKTYSSLNQLAFQTAAPPSTLCFRILETLFCIFSSAFCYSYGPLAWLIPTGQLRLAIACQCVPQGLRTDSSLSHLAFLGFQTAAQPFCNLCSGLCHQHPFLCFLIQLWPSGLAYIHRSAAPLSIDTFPIAC